MPSVYTENMRKWLELAEVDYIGPFVKAWLAFNAWYRHAYTLKTDREILNEVRWQPNIIRNKLVPMLGQTSEEAEQFRAHIGDLHHRLEAYHIHTGHGDDAERITFTNVFLKKRTVTAQTQSRYRRVYKITPGPGNSPALTVTVQLHTGIQVLNITQPRFDLVGLQADPAFQSLNSDQQGTLLSIYRSMNPREIVDLRNNGGPLIQCGTYELRCSSEHLFAGLCEVIYSMRCSLFHGELVPDPEAVACYEPAYRILRRFLTSINWKG
jgi:hypothetical protein